MARVGLYLYIVVLYQNGVFTLLRKRIGPVKEKRRGVLWVVAVPAERVLSGRYAIWGCFIRVGVVPLIVRGVRLVWGYFAKYNGGIFYII